MILRILLSDVMKTIKKDKIAGLLDFLAEKYELYAPLSDDDLVVDFRLIRKGDSIKLDFYNSKDTPKKLFFPQSQTLFSYSEESPASVPQQESQKKRVRFLILALKLFLFHIMLIDYFHLMIITYWII